jgi:phosphoglycerate kinase
MRSIPFLDSIEIKGKVVFLRVDFNVPISGTGIDKKIDDDTRIREALPTIEYCAKSASKVVLCSHLGRPDGKRDSKYSLELVAVRLAELLGQEIYLSDELYGEGVEQLARHARDPKIILLENIRFDPREEENDPEFAKLLARLADVYITDAFGTAHRKHASTFGVAECLNDAGAGFLIQKELNFLNRLINAPAHPYILVAGGSKVTDKLKAIDHLLNFVDQVIVGGAMAYAFMAAQKIGIGRSKCEAEGIPAAEQIVKKAASRNVELLLPVDHVIAYPDKDPELKNPIVWSEIAIPSDAVALDIGPRTREKFAAAISQAKTIFWNGPQGFFEREQYLAGTKAIAEAICASSAVKVAGGGDTLSAIHLLGLSEGFDLLSTGGGASLKYLEGKGLPGIEILRGKRSPVSKKLNTDDSDLL